jgi:hypothetical protein
MPDTAPSPPPAPEPRVPAAVYANQFEVGYNAFEFLIRFGQQFEESTPAPAAQLRVVMPPAYAKVLLQVLGGSLAAYETAFGEIPAGPAGGA